MDELKLNIGAGQTYICDFRNIDIAAKAEIQLDVGKDPLPFEDNSVSLVFSYHTLEHIPDYLFALGEIYRVLKHDGTLLLGVPYVTLTEYNLVNPYHLHNFNEHSFDFFDETKLKGSAAEQNSISFKQVFCRFHYLGSFQYLPRPIQSWSRRHLFNVVKMFDVGVVAVKDRSSPLDLSPERAERMRATFDECLGNRRPYPRPAKLPNLGVVVN